MTHFFTRKYIKIPIVALVIISMMLQFMPARQPARASILDWLQKTLSKINIPTIGIEEDGALRIGNWTIVECFGTYDEGKCVNPFSKMSLGGINSQTDLVDAKGNLKMPHLSFPPECELRVPMPEDDEKMSEAQKLAQRKACTYFRRIQKQAAQQVFLAKKMFNSTDPFTECFFLRNCRSDCGIKLGELKFTITLLDIANMFLPTGFITVIQKILNVVKIISQLVQIWEQVKNLLANGLAIVQNVMSVINQVHSFFMAFTKTGLKMSDALIYGAGAIASSYAGGKLQGIGEREGGKVGWLAGEAGDLLKSGDGLIGGAAATAVFNSDRAKQGWDGMKDLLLRFAENNRKFAQAKKESLDFLRRIEGDVETVRSHFKIEKEIDFLFNSETDDAKELEKIVDDYFMVFESIDTFLGDMVQAGELKTGDTIATVKTGAEEINGDVIAYRAGHLYEDAKPAYFNINVDTGGGGRGVGVPAEYETIKVTYEDDIGTPQNVCRFDLPRVVNFNSCAILNNEVDSNFVVVERVLRELIDGLPAYYPDQQLSYSTAPSLFVSRLKNAAGQCESDWLSTFQDIHPTVENLEVLLSPDHIIGVVERALNGYVTKKNDDGEDIEVYFWNVLNDGKGPWQEYWHQIATALGVPVEGREFKYILESIMDAGQERLNIASFGHIRNIQNDGSGWFGNRKLDDPNEWKSLGGPKGWVENQVRKYEEARDKNDLQKIGQAISGKTKKLEENIEKLWWERVGLLANYIYYNNPNNDYFEHTPYWREQAWVTNNADVPPCSIGISPAEGPKNIKKWFFDGSYESDVMYHNWDDRIEILAKTSDGISMLEQSLEWNVSPQDPIMVYTAEKARRQLKDLSSKASASITDETRAILEAAINETIEGLKIETDFPQNKSDYDNYVNCCACEADKRGKSNVACSSVSNQLCCGKELTITAESVDETGEACRPGPAGTMPDTLDNLACGSAVNGVIAGAVDGYARANACRLKYKNGTGSCFGGPSTYVPVSWISSYSNCSSCITSCRNNCSRSCTSYISEVCWKCDERGDSSERCRSNDRDARNACERVCDDEDGDQGDCDWESTSYQYDCPLTAAQDTYSSQASCTRACTRPNCSNDSACETSYCSTRPSNTGANGGACWWENYYDDQRDSFDTHAELYKSGFNRYVYYERQVQLLEGIRMGLDDMLSTSGDLIKGLEVEFENLKDEFIVLQEVWEATPTTQRESGIARDYIDKIHKSILISQNIVGEDGTGGIVGDIQTLLGHITILRDSLLALIATASLDPDVEARLQAGLIVKLNEFVLIIETEIIFPLQAKLGAYEDDCLPKGQSCPLIEGICLKDEAEGLCSQEELQCARKDGFLNRIACFEEDNDRTFKELFDFIAVLHNFESIALAMPFIEENIEAIKPEWDINPPTIRPDLVDLFEDKAKACGKAIVPDFAEPIIPPGATKEENEAICDEKVTIFEGQLPEDTTFETFKKSLFSNPLSAIENNFTKIQGTITDYVNPSIAASGFDRDVSTERGFERDTVFGNDNKRLNLYYTALGGVKEEISTLWYDFIWGVDENLRDACYALSPIFDNHPSATEEDCKSDDLDVSLLDDDVLIEQCESLDRIPYDTFEKLVEDPDFIDNELARLKAERLCVGGEIDCGGRTECVQCPRWLCRSKLDIYKWALYGDPECYEDKNGNGEFEAGEEKIGVTGGIIWDASDIEVEDDDRVKADLCTKAGFPLVVCTVGELSAKCDEFNAKVKGNMDVFDMFDEQAQKMEAINKLQDEMTCIAYENCSWGFDDTLSGFTLTTTDVSGDVYPCITCPKWICAKDGNQLPPLMADQDPYCVDADAGLITDGVLNNGIVWDTSWPSGLREWVRKTACLSEHGASLPAVYADRFSNKPLNWMTGQCIQKQAELKTLIDDSGGVIIEFPWETENWPCQTKEACENLDEVCQLLGTGDVVPPPSGWREWPPDDPCGGNDYVSKKEGRETRCMQTQQGLKDLLAMKGFIDELGDTSKLQELSNQCVVLGYQNEIKEECDNFYTLRQAFNCSGNSCDDPPYPEAEDLNKKLKPFCQTDVEITEFECSFGSPRLDMTFNTFTTFNGEEPDELDLGEQEDKQEEVNKSSKARTRAKRLCSESFNDMRTPLNEVMKVFSVLLGIKSYTGAKQSSAGLVNVDLKALRNKDWKSLVGADLKALYGQATHVIGMITGIPDMIKSKWGEKDEAAGGSIQLGPPQCISRPMASYTSQGVRVTGSDGGPVCPDLGNIFAQLDAKFSLIRNDLRQIDLVRRDHKTELSIGKLGIGIETLPINDKLNEYVSPLYEAAKDIRDKTQFLWALATAVNFANQDCTCGQSWCPQIGKIPFCVSGIPLTITPLKKPQCSLVWLLRYPLGSLATRIEQQLEEQFKE